MVYITYWISCHDTHSAINADLSAPMGLILEKPASGVRKDREALLVVLVMNDYRGNNHAQDIQRRKYQDTQSNKV